MGAKPWLSSLLLPQMLEAAPADPGSAICIMGRSWNQPVKLSAARKAISDYRKAVGDAEGLAELMSFYAECGIEYTVAMGDIDEPFYISVEKVFLEGLKMLKNVRKISLQGSCLGSFMPSNQPRVWAGDFTMVFLILWKKFSLDLGRIGTLRNRETMVMPSGPANTSSISLHPTPNRSCGQCIRQGPVCYPFPVISYVISGHR